ASFLTPTTICSAVSVGPEGNLRGSSCPVARILTVVPPTSTTSTFMATPSLKHTLVSPRRMPRGAQRPSVHGLTGFCQRSALGSEHLHEFVPGLHERFGPFFLELGG